VIDEERVSGPCLDRDGDPMTVVRAEGEHAKNKKIERALEQGISRGIVSS
jgi:hypothetical protein